MTKILAVGDIHFSDRPPSSCTETYLEDLFTMMWWTVDFVNKRDDIGAVVWAGDVFHHKAPSRTSHGTVQRIIELGQSYNPAWCIIVGNHDIQSDRVDSVSDTQPLGTLFRAGAVDLRGWSDQCGGPSLPLYGIPWLQHWSSDEAVSVALADYRSRDAGSRPALIATHAPLYPLGIELPFEFYSVKSFAERMNGHGSVYYGHVHEAHGIFEVGGVTFCNHGAITRGSLHEYNITRDLAVTLWDTETGLFEKVPIPHKPASEVFRLASKASQKTAQQSLDEFLTQIGSTTLGVTSVESVQEHIRTLDLEPAVRDMALQLLVEANK